MQITFLSYFCVLQVRSVKPLLRHDNNFNWQMDWLNCDWFKATIENVEKLVSGNLTKPRQIYWNIQILKIPPKNFSSKSDSHLPKNSFICLNKSILKMMKHAFYFILKALFILKIFRFLSWRFGHEGKRAWLER